MKNQDYSQISKWIFAFRVEYTQQKKRQEALV